MIAQRARWGAAVLAAAILVSCSGGDDEPELSAATSVVGSADVGDTDPTEPTDPEPTVVASTEPVATDAPPETLSASDRADETCTLSTGDRYETTKQAVDDADVVDLVATQCPDVLDAIVAARALEASTTAIADVAEPIELTRLQCADGQYSFVATSRVSAPIGVHAVFRIFVGDDDQPTFSANYPIVIWRLDEDQSQGIEGTFPVPEDGDYRCTLNARVFNADDTAASAGFGDASLPNVIGDDPTEWFGALLTAESAAIGTGDPDAAARIEDLRSVGYDNVLRQTAGSEPPPRTPLSVTVCNGSIDQPSDDRMSFIYYITYPAESGEADATESFLRHGLFKRGSDDQWRWLSSAQYFNSPDFWGCGVPTSAE